MIRFFTTVFVFLILFSCKEEAKTKVISASNNTEEVKPFNDKNYVVAKGYEVGDVRRYGIYPDSTFSLNHPFTKKSKLETVLDLAEKHNIELTFPKGFYNLRLAIQGRKNIMLNFNDAVFSGIIQVYEKDSTISENITFKGNLSSYEGFFTRKSKNISLDTLHLLNDVTKSMSKQESKGCKLYGGTNGFKLKSLVVEGLGSNSETFKYNGAALAIEGWNNNPKNVIIDNVHIKSSDKHGVYMTGTDNSIKKLTIDKFGVGSKVFLTPLEDATKGEEKEFTGLWLNKCNYCFVDKAIINEAGSKATNTVFMDAGVALKASEIVELIILNDNPKIGIKKDPNTNIQLISTTIK